LKQFIRLSDKEIEIIKNSITQIFGENEIYIFGSRLKDKKGGDIDIFIIPQNKENLFEKRLKALVLLEKQLFKPVDLVIHKNFDRIIEKEGLKGVKL
jgi:predicted nucleotidyltransferase